MASTRSISHRDRIYVHQLNLTSADIMRKQREKETMWEEKRKLRDSQNISRRQKEEEKKRDRQMLLVYNPWGKPGGGAPKDETKRTKFEEEMLCPPEYEEEELDEEDSNHKLFNSMFGRPGNGAPNRTLSGKIQTQIPGDPVIRFQDSQQVRRSIENQLRYKNQNKESYCRNLDQLIHQKQILQDMEKEYDSMKIKEMHEQYPFGKNNGNGGSHLSSSDPVFMQTRRRRRQHNQDDFDPWGKGHGNPDRDLMGNTQRHKFAPSTVLGVTQVTPPDSQMGIALNLGRIRGGGAGAPILTNSGNAVTRLPKTLDNVKSMGPFIKEMEDTSEEPWRKMLEHEGTVQRKTGLFEERMGWSLTGDPKKRTKDAKLAYMQALKKEMEHKKRRGEEEKLTESQGIVRFHPPTKEESLGVGLASVIRQGVGGRPKLDETGELARNPIQLTDVTSQAMGVRRVKSQESLRYHDELSQQAAQRQEQREKQRAVERAQSQQHLHTLESFWGRPGHGAPKNVEHHRKENLNSLLTNPGASEPYVKNYVAEVVPSMHKNRYEFPIRDDHVIKQKEFEFRTPYPATEA